VSAVAHAKQAAACIEAAWATTGIELVAKLLLIALAMSTRDSGDAPISISQLATTVSTTPRETERALHALMVARHITVIGAAPAAIVAQVHPNGVIA
jgi:hypothetical protein